MMDNDSERRPSWPYPIILFLYVVIFLATPVLGSTIALSLFFLLIGICVWNAASKSHFEKLKDNYPALPRSDYVFNMLIFPVIFPLIIFGIVMVIRWVLTS